jgi:hypothetical protein
MSPYDHLPARHFWRTGVAEQDPNRIPGLYQAKFRIAPTDLIASAGSCFAQHIGRSLKQNGFHYLDAEPAPDYMSPAARPKFGYGLFSARFGNIYTSRQLLQLIQRAYGRFQPADDIWETDGRFYDAFRPSIEEGGFGSREELLALRNAHLAAVRRMFETANLFVFTLGLTEVWTSRRDGAAYPMCPGTISGTFDDARYAFLNLGYHDVLQDLNAFLGALREINRAIKLIFTVSPVPLTATASGQHVLVATMASKAILRAVAGELAGKHDFIDYFPSFELLFGIQARAAGYEPNLRSVRPSAVEMVMGHFFEQHGKGSADPGIDARERSVAAAEEAADDLICDEERLDR